MTTPAGEAVGVASPSGDGTRRPGVPNNLGPSFDGVMPVPAPGPARSPPSGSITSPSASGADLWSSTMCRSTSPRASSCASSALSGCGKSTLLNLIAGLDQTTAGSIQTPAAGSAVMFQESALHAVAHRPPQRRAGAAPAGNAPWRATRGGPRAARHRSISRMPPRSVRTSSRVACASASRLARALARTRPCC